MEKKILEKVYKWEYFPFFCMFIIWFLLHCVLFKWMGDDIGNLEEVLSRSMLDDIKSIVNPSAWSSRVIINKILGPFCYRIVNKYSVLLWCVFDSGFLVLIGVSFLKIVYRLFHIDNNYLVYIIIGVIFSYPFMEMNSAGWIATTYSYLWPASIGIWFISEYVESIFEFKNIWGHVLCGIGLIVAVNIEGGAVFFGCLFLCIFLIEVTAKRVRYSTIYYTIISIGGICWHLFSTGNKNRVVGEVMMNFKNYYMLNFIDKIELTFNRCTYYYIFNFNNIFLLFSLFLCLAVKGRCKDSFYRTIGSIPLLITILFGIVGKLGLYGKLNIGGTLSKDGAITVSNYNSFSSYISTMLGIIVCLCICISFYVVLNQYSHLIIAICIFAGGMGSWMVMMLSPTVWASNSRPFTTLNFVFLGLLIWLLCVVLKTKAMNEKMVNGIVWILAMCNIFNHIL